MSAVSDTVRKAIQVNAEREHFAEAYEGFNDCAWYANKPCDCGKAEAEIAWEELSQSEHRNAAVPTER